MFLFLILVNLFVGVAVCVQLIRVIRSALKRDERVWYQFMVLVLLAVAETLAVLALNKWVG